MTFTIPVILMVLLAASYGGHSINSKAISPSADTVFYRIDTTIKQMEKQFWELGLQFLREKRKKLKKIRCYLIVDETHDSYTGKLLKKEKKVKENLKKGKKPREKEGLTEDEQEILKYIHKYKPEKGDTGSYKYLVFAIVYGNKRRVLRVKAIKKKEDYKPFIIQTLKKLRKEVSFKCVMFDRGFYDGAFIEELKRYKIPFILRAKISKTMKVEYGFYAKWKRYNDYEIGESKAEGDLILGVDYTQGKKTKWAFITNMEFDNLYEIRKIYKKRWNIENIFKATDGIQLMAQTNNPTIRLFCVCLSFLFYNAWQSTHKRRNITLNNFVMDILETIFEFIIRLKDKTVEFYRDRLKINIPFWCRIISSI